MVLILNGSIDDQQIISLFFSLSCKWIPISRTEKQQKRDFCSYFEETVRCLYATNVPRVPWVIDSLHLIDLEAELKCTECLDLGKKKQL